MIYASAADNIEFVVLNDFYREFVWNKPRPRVESMRAQETEIFEDTKLLYNAQKSSEHVEATPKF